MTLEQLRIFVAVAERLHVTRASEELGITQSGASAAIAALESSSGLELFHRVGRRIELTVAGNAFISDAKAVLAQAVVAELTLSELSSMQRGALSIYASQTVANYWLPARLGEFRQLYPGIQLNMKIGNTRQVAAAVLDGSVDLGFAECRVDEPGLEQTEFKGDKLVLIFAEDHFVGHREKSNLAELRSIPWVLRERGSGTRQIFEEAWRQLGVDPISLNIVLELPSNEAVLMAVESGLGSTVISNLVTKRSRLRPVDVGFEPRLFSVLRHRERAMNKAQQAMLAIVHRRQPGGVKNVVLTSRYALA